MRTILLLALLLAACSPTALIRPYKIDVQQGNFIDHTMAAKLKPDMTKSQVRFVLGTPLIADPFHADRWDYVYYDKHGYQAPTERRLTVIFANDKLVGYEVVPAFSGPSARNERMIEGSGPLPGAAGSPPRPAAASQPTQAAAGAQAPPENAQPAPPAPPTGLKQKVMEILGFDEDTASSSGSAAASPVQAHSAAPASVEAVAPAATPAEAQPEAEAKAAPSKEGKFKHAIMKILGFDEDDSSADQAQPAKTGSSRVEAPKPSEGTAKESKFKRAFLRILGIDQDGGGQDASAPQSGGQ